MSVVEVVAQQHPPAECEVHQQSLGESIGLARLARVLGSVCPVLSLDERRVDLLADRRGSQSRVEILLCTEDQLTADAVHLPLLEGLADRGIDGALGPLQIGRTGTARLSGPLRDDQMPIL